MFPYLESEGVGEDKGQDVFGQVGGEIEKLIDNGQCAEAALEYMCDMFISMFSATDDELTQQRAADRCV